MRKLLLALTACATHQPPYVQCNTQLCADAVNGWGALGFVAGTEDPGLPECSRTWYSDTFGADCQITLTVEIVPNLTDDDVGGGEILGVTNGRHVRINARLTGDALHHTALHEVGHALLGPMHLDSYNHPPWGFDGVMRSWGSTDLAPTANDYALACHTVGICHLTSTTASVQ